ncbi:MAG: hypothetical protein RLZZ423_1718 [Cyanobacteriota bacterium]|jgi:hypothetical protein
MQRSVPWFWILAIGLLVLAPGLTARLFVDVLEGAALLVVVGPLLLAGAGLLAWQWAKRRLTVCPACGTPSFGALQCPACGTSLSGVPKGGSAAAGAAASRAPEVGDARDAVIDVSVTEVREP